MVRKDYFKNLRKLSPEFWKLKKPQIITLHDPKQRVNKQIQAVREIDKKAYYYQEDHGKVKDARDHQKYLRERGHNAQIKKINNRHVVFSRKRKK